MKTRLVLTMAGIVAGNIWKSSWECWKSIWEYQGVAGRGILDLSEWGWWKWHLNWYFKGRKSQWVEVREEHPAVATPSSWEEAKPAWGCEVHMYINIQETKMLVLKLGYALEPLRGTFKNADFQALFQSLILLVGMAWVLFKTPHMLLTSSKIWKSWIHY